MFCRLESRLFSVTQSYRASLTDEAHKAAALNYQHDSYDLEKINLAIVLSCEKFRREIRALAAPEWIRTDGLFNYDLACSSVTTPFCADANAGE